MHPNYYAAFVIGPDGHNVEVVCHCFEVIERRRGLTNMFRCND